MSAPLQRLTSVDHAMGRMLYTEDEITCPILPDPTNYHFEGRCEDCDAKYLSRMTLGEVEDRYHVGRVTQDGYEAYIYVWALLSPTGSRPYDRATPTDPTVRRIARKLLRLRGFEVPAALVDTVPTPKTPTSTEPWRAAVNGTGKRPWFVMRDDAALPISERYHNDKNGDLIRFGSYEAATERANQLNAAQGGESR